MTELARPAPPRARPPAVAWVSVCAFLGVLATLAWEMHLGRDPAVHSGFVAPAAPRRVLVRRIVKRVIVVDVVPAPTAAAGGSGGGAAAPAGAGATSVSSSPVSAAPVPAPAPAPAPVTRTS